MILKWKEHIDLLKKKITFDGIKRELKIHFIKNKIVSIIGPRRAGKTYFLYQLYSEIKEPKLYLNFENLYLKHLEAKEVMSIIDLYEELFGYKPKYLFFDEIQEIKDWNSLLRTLLDLNYKIVITGSSSKLLGKEIATQLRGRSIHYLLLPFSFREFLNAKEVSFENIDLLSQTEINQIKHYLNEYIQYGGFPEIVFNELKDKILEAYLNDLLYKDFIERHQLENITLAKFLFEFLRQNYASYLSMKKIINFLKDRVSFSKKTLYKYLENIEDPLMFYFVESFDKNIYRKKKANKKVYICDLGFSDNDDLGKKIENLVFLELLRLNNVLSFNSISYYFTKNKKEIDFLIKKKNKLTLIEVCYELDKDHIKKVLKAMKELNLKKAYIINYDREDVIKINDSEIFALPLWKFLLSPDVIFASD